MVPRAGAGIPLEACNPDLGEAKVYLAPFAGLPLAFLETVCGLNSQGGSPSVLSVLYTLKKFIFLGTGSSSR